MVLNIRRYTDSAIMRRAHHIIRRSLIVLVVIGASYVAAHFFIAPIASLVDRHPKTAGTPADWGHTFETYVVRGAAGNRLTYWYVNGASEKGQIILLPNNGGNKSRPLMRWTTRILTDEGFNVVLADPRGQGDSRGIKTYGYGESLDIVKLILDIKDRYPARPIGGLGYSVGAATLLRSMGMERQLRAVVSFATYSRLDSGLVRKELSYQTAGRWQGQGVMLGLIAKSFRFWAFSFRRVPSPLDSVRQLQDQHVLLMHFKNDPELPVAYSLEIYDEAPLELVDLHIYDERKHVPWNRAHRFEADFRERIVAFFSRYL